MHEDTVDFIAGPHKGGSLQRRRQASYRHSPGLPRLDLEPRMHMTAFRMSAKEIRHRIQAIVEE